MHEMQIIRIAAYLDANKKIQMLYCIQTTPQQSSQKPSIAFKEDFLINDQFRKLSFMGYTA